MLDDGHFLEGVVVLIWKNDPCPWIFVTLNIMSRPRCKGIGWMFIPGFIAALICFKA